MIVAVIPIRSGSVRCRDKNIRLLGGRPLVDWAIKPARYSKYIDMVVVSTDSQEYQNIAQKCGAMVPFLRPKELAEDVPTEMVIQHAVNELEEKFPILNKNRIEIIVTLQCTSPFIESSYIDACVEALLKDKEADSSLTVKAVKEYPQWMYYSEGRYLKRLVGGNLKGDEGVSQKLPTLYIPTGMCYADRRETIMDKGLIIGEKPVPIIVPNERCIDIDYDIDFQIAETVGKYLNLIGGWRDV